MRLKIIRLFGMLFVFCFMMASKVMAVPYADIDIFYQDNGDGTFTYQMNVHNQGPILPDVATPGEHMVYVDKNAYFAGSKKLDDDENIVLFGVDTGETEIEISDIDDAGSSFHGTEEPGWLGTKVVAWHLPFFGWTLDDTIQPGNKLKGLSFTLNKEIKAFNVWVGGSDDASIWDEAHVMAEDQFGIYDATLEKYTATLLDRSIHAKKKYKIYSRNSNFIKKYITNYTALRDKVCKDKQATCLHNSSSGD